VALTAGVDLGGTKIQTAIVRAGRALGQARLPTPQGGPADVLESVHRTIVDAADAAGITSADLTAVGIGFPGAYDNETGDTVSAVNLAGFDKRYPFGSRLSSAIGGAPVVFDGDVRAAMLGEQRAGAGRPFKDMLGVFVGTGVGGGLILEGRLRRGLGAAGEIGHTVVSDGGRLCGCGRRGCLEAYAGRGRIEMRARKLVEKGDSTILFKVMAEKGKDRLTSGVIATALDRGDKMAGDLISEAVWALGIALASVQNVLDLEAIIIGGGLGDRLGRPFIDRVSAAMEPHLFMDGRPPKMLATELGDLSGAVGAALLAVDSMASSPRAARSR
jgi:glucokinase